MLGSIRNLYRIIAGTIGLISVAIQYWLIVLDGSRDAFVSTIHFFSYFTILSNILAALALLLPVVAPASRVGRFLGRPPVRAAIAGYIIIVGTVYYLLLRNVGHAQGWTLFFEHVLHYVTPPLFVLDWLIFVPKGEVAWRNGLACLGFPAVYAVWTLTHGALTGWYPYPFIDVPELGYPRTLLNMAGLIAAFVALELVLIGLDRLMGRSRHNGKLS
jgi:hypothetical protein